MPFFTLMYEGRQWAGMLAFGAVLLSCPLSAQTETNSSLASPGQMSQDSRNAATNASATNAPPVVAAPSEPAASASATVQPVASPLAPLIATKSASMNKIDSLFGALITLSSVGGFLLYYCGLTRAKNSGHTSTLLLVGMLFGLTGYWIGGFAVQTGGVGDTHAALAHPVMLEQRSVLNHELGFIAGGHYWGIMGSSGFFLISDDSAPGGTAELFLTQAVLVALVVAGALGAALERGRLLAMGFCSFLIGVLVYPLFANWTWGGGWLAELGRDFGLGHGFIDLGGAGVVHETLGTLALVLATILGPRVGRFTRNNLVQPIPGHNVPFIVLGSVVLLISWMATNAFASTHLVADPAVSVRASPAGLAAVNTLLGAMGGMMVSFIQASWQKKRPEPARLCRGLLGGAVATCGCAGLIDPWAAFVIGSVAGLLVQAAMVLLERQHMDDPVGAAAVHGAGGAWGVLALGLFANGTTGIGTNGVATPIRGFFFGGAWHQLAAQAIGCVTDFVVIYILGYAFISLVHQVLGLRVDLTSETNGLDWTEVGTLGYQGDIDPDDAAPRR